MPGDTIRAEVYAKYIDPTSANWTGALTTLMGQIASSATGVVIDGASYSTSTSSFPFGGLLTQSTSGSAPKAYLNWIVFDRDYAMLDGGYTRMTTAAKETGSGVAHEQLVTGDIVIKEPGYVYLYLSNEETTELEVFFDDFRVAHARSPVVQQDEYYPEGALFNSFTRENSLLNKYKYQSKELQTELGLDLSDFGPRWYNGWTLRTTTQDPHAEKYYPWSSYSWAFDDPMKFGDPTGKDPEESVSLGTLFSKAVEAATNMVSFLFGGGDDGSEESAATYGDAHTTMQAVGAEAQSMKAKLQDEVEPVPGLNMAFNIMDAQQAKTTGETMQHLGKALQNANSMVV